MASIIHKFPGELRNIVYDKYFSGLPPATAPLKEACKYRPETSLCFVDRGIASETLGYLSDIHQAWQECTWQVDLDNTYPTPSIYSRLTDADAANIRTIEFKTSAFALEKRQGEQTLSEPFSFQVKRLSTHRLEISTGLNDAYWQQGDDLMVHRGIHDVLEEVHLALCVKQWYDVSRGRGRHAWTAKEIETLVRLVKFVVARSHDDHEQLTAMGVPGHEMTWSEMWSQLDARGVWEGNLPMDRKMKLWEIENWVEEDGYGMGDCVWAENDTREVDPMEVD